MTHLNSPQGRGGRGKEDGEVIGQVARVVVCLGMNGGSE